MKQRVKHCIFLASRSRRRFSERSHNFSLIAMRRFMQLTVRTMTFMFCVSFSTYTMLLVDGVGCFSFITDKIVSFSLGCQVHVSIVSLQIFSRYFDLYSIEIFDRYYLFIILMISATSRPINFLFSFSSSHFPFFTFPYNTEFVRHSILELFSIML